jgi:hypothetical protein
LPATATGHRAYRHPHDHGAGGGDEARRGAANDQVQRNSANAGSVSAAARLSRSVFDLAGFKARRFQQCGDPTAPFLVGATTGKRLTANLVAKRWKALMRVVLGNDRAKQLSIQSGRRTDASFAAANGRSLVEITADLGLASPLHVRRPPRRVNCRRTSAIRQMASSPFCERQTA